MIHSGVFFKETTLAHHVHILGICGTFMGGLALLARQSGLRVTGSDANVYPPMSTQLEAAGIDLMEGYEPETRIVDGPITIGNWSPKNYSHRYAGRTNLMTALAKSLLPLPVSDLTGKVKVSGGDLDMLELSVASNESIDLLGPTIESAKHVEQGLTC